VRLFFVRLWSVRNTTVLALVLLGSTVSATPLEDALAPHCTFDARLSRVAAEAVTHPNDFSAISLRSLAWNVGLRAPAVHALVLQGGEEISLAQSVTSWMVRQETSPELSRCATSGWGDMLAVVVVPRVIEVEGDTVRGWRVAGLPLGVSSMTLFATSGENVLRAPLVPNEWTSLALSSERPWTLQVMGDFHTGPLAIAQWNNPSPQHSATETTTSDLWSSRHILGAINTLRGSVGALPLRRDPMLDRAATQHAQRLAALERVEHVPSPGDSPVDRLRDVGVISNRVAENVARAHSLTEAHERLLVSPAHRANLVDPLVDSIGFGIARSSGNVYVVEMFAAHPAMQSAL
jgi:uncharacterized protein YkwD